MLYSLGAMTTFGNAGVLLEYRWRLLGTIEALGGWLLFGLSTAFMFGMIQKMWLLERQEQHETEEPVHRASSSSSQATFRLP
jgi:hypothetical protein